MGGGGGKENDGLHAHQPDNLVSGSRAPVLPLDPSTEHNVSCECQIDSVSAEQIPRFSEAVHRFNSPLHKSEGRPNSSAPATASFGGVAIEFFGSQI